MQSRVPRPRVLGFLLSLTFAASSGRTTALAQAPDQGPFAPSATGNQGIPRIPGTEVPGATLPEALPPAAPPSGPMTQAQLEQEVRQLRILVNQLSARLQQGAPSTGPRPPNETPTGARNIDGATTATPATPDIGSVASTVAPSRSGGVSAPGQSLPPNPPPTDRFNQPSTLDSVRGNFKFGPGFELRTDDEEFILQFHNLTQFDYRGYLQGGQNPVRDTFAFPRQWFMFSGRISKPIGYFVSLQNGFDTVSLLDAFLDLDIRPEFRLRAGRFKTPFTYEFFVEPVQGLVVPERSVFFNNFGQNRDLGIMPYGRLFNNTLDYAGGIFNGTRNGFLANQNGKFTSWFVSWKPFNNEEGLLENFKIGGSVFAGNMNQAPIPQTLRTVVATSGNSILGVPFLTFNNNVRQTGPMAFWDLHAVWFYKHLAILGEWGSGYQEYSIGNGPRTKLPVQSYYVQGSYLITGETRSGIGIVKPINPVSFGRGKGWTGTGAIEPYFRYEYMDISNQVFTGGFADPNLWANRLFQTHTGVTWHLTQYLKIFFDWNHSEFNQPVFFAPNRRQLTSDLFWVRLQLFF